MSSSYSADAPVRWSRVAEGFFVASVDGDFVGYIDQDDEDVFFAYDGHGTLLGGAPTLAAAMATVRGHAAQPFETLGASPLVSIVYTSLATTRFDPDRLAALLDQSRAANAARDVTGVLLYRDGRFLQVLEGPRPAVAALLETIRTDPRHHGVHLLVEDAIEERSFGDWSMGYRRWNAPAVDLPEGFRDAFDDLETLTSSWDGRRAARELLAWFRYRPLADEDGD